MRGFARTGSACVVSRVGPGEEIARTDTAPGHAAHEAQRVLEVGNLCRQAGEHLGRPGGGLNPATAGRDHDRGAWAGGIRGDVRDAGCETCGQRRQVAAAMRGRERKEVVGLRHAGDRDGHGADQQRRGQAVAIGPERGAAEEHADGTDDHEQIDGGAARRMRPLRPGGEDQKPGVGDAGHRQNQDQLGLPGEQTVPCVEIPRGSQQPTDPRADAAHEPIAQTGQVDAYPRRRPQRQDPIYAAEQRLPYNTNDNHHHGGRHGPRQERPNGQRHVEWVFLPVRLRLLPLPDDDARQRQHRRCRNRGNEVGCRPRERVVCARRTGGSEQRRPAGRGVAHGRRRALGAVHRGDGHAGTRERHDAARGERGPEQIPERPFPVRIAVTKAAGQEDGIQGPACTGPECDAGQGDGQRDRQQAEAGPEDRDAQAPQIEMPQRVETARTVHGGAGWSEVALVRVAGGHGRQTVIGYSSAACWLFRTVISSEPSIGIDCPPAAIAAVATRSRSIVAPGFDPTWSR